MELYVQPLTREAFTDYGDVLETDTRSFFHINEGQVERYHDLAKVEVLQQDRVLISINRAKPLHMPVVVTLLEKHPLGTQAFFPMNRERFIIVVALGDTEPDLTTLRAFITNGFQGVNYYRNVWHHPLFAFQETTDFITIDRGGKDNCDVCEIHPHYQLNL